MISLHLLAAAAAVSGVGETVLIDFTSDRCGPCRAMAPTVDRLAREGFPVRKVNVDRQQALAQKYGVRGIPCFVMLVDGREVDRVVGGTSYARLKQMLGKASVRRPGPSAKQATATPPRQPHSNPRSDPIAAQLLRASVRLRIESADGRSFGSGTIIDSRQGAALVLTCGHLFRETKGGGKISVETFDGGRVRRYDGQLIRYDDRRDVGLVSFRADVPLATARVAGPGTRVSRNDRVINIGCNHGQRPTVRTGAVLAMNSFVGPANIKVSGQPVQGRSGGGLFTADGQLIGICSFADPTDKAGAYTALSIIHEELDRGGLGNVYRKTDRGPSSSRAAALRDVVVSGPPDSAARTLNRDVVDALNRDVEVICIVRSSQGAELRSEVIVLEDASAAFLDRLADERSRQAQRHRTSLDLPRRTPDSPDGPSAAIRASGWQPRWRRPADR